MLQLFFTSFLLRKSQLRMPSFFSLFAVLSIVCVIISFRAVASVSTIDLTSFNSGTLGKYTEYFQETSKKLTLQQAIKRFERGEIKVGSSNSISLGLDVAPVWMLIKVNNSSRNLIDYRLALETPWIDFIDTWLIHDGQTIDLISGGDGYPFEQRPMPYRYYAFEHAFKPGTTHIVMRVETKGPMALPLQFSTREAAIQRDISGGYQYGILYGIMGALALYNLVLFVFIRQREYGLYSLYLMGFILNSLSYTGQLHTIFTPDFGPYFQDWLDIFLMITYSIAGLHFARTLLDTRSYAPNLDKFVILVTVLFPLGMLVGFVLDNLFLSMALAFVLNTCFVILFVVMGLKALAERRKFAKVFLVSSVAAAVCITISTLAVAGVLVPYNDFCS